MIDGAFTGRNDDEIVAYVLAHPLVVDDGADEQPAGEHNHEPSGITPDDGTAQNENTPSDDEPVRRTPDQGEPDWDDPDEDGPDGSDPGGEHQPPGRPPGASDCGGRQRAWSARELRVELTTLLGHDNHPAEIPPWAYVPAQVARDMVADMRDAEWRFVICCDQGRPICSGITIARPAVNSGETGRHTRRREAGVVEIQIRARDLCVLDAECAEIGAYPRWARVITDIAKRVDAGDVDSDAAADQARRRTPGPGLRRLIEVRARYCTHPACNAPAIECDQDHRVEYANGGQTTADNLHSPCRHDHRLRHDGGWFVMTFASGETTWISPLGHTYASLPPPVMIDAPRPWEILTTIDLDDH